MFNLNEKLFLLILLIVAMTACSKQAWYQSAISSRQKECRDGPVSEYDRCMETTEKTYSEYEKDRKKLSK
ncbi:MAG TPA: hypothetical protein ENJ87_06425 [Gammaproteobacteria bacterium]|nr:hypothetical protein [Gammaproteobacteria bacterium]